ncbi:MAG: hypothetical protein OXF79_28125 [Chloroflexi bacterium]|nr:hypothetical protein [Chloroflexota bacterium]
MPISEATVLALISAAAGLFGVVVGAALPWFRDAWNNKRNARYLAIRVVCILDDFLDQCTDVVGDDGLSLGQRNAGGELRPQVSQPTGLPLPSDVDWRSIDHELMYNVLALPSRIENDNRFISIAAEHSFPPDYIEFFEERRHRYACLGLHVISVTQQLRSTYGISEQELGDWDPITFLNNEKDKIEQRRIDREKNSTVLDDL